MRERTEQYERFGTIDFLKMQRAFTLVELLFVIVIIGILAAVAIPKFKGLSANSKISSELATASTVQSAIEDVHSDWVVSEGDFVWGNGKKNNSQYMSPQGYPKQLGDCEEDNNKPFSWILKNSATVDSKWECKNNGDGTFYYKGPASKKDSGVKPSSDVKGKPDCSDYWKYDNSKGTFELIDEETQTCTGVDEL